MNTNIYESSKDCVLNSMIITKEENADKLNIYHITKLVNPNFVVKSLNDMKIFIFELISKSMLMHLDIVIPFDVCNLFFVVL